MVFVDMSFDGTPLCYGEFNWNDLVTIFHATSDACRRGFMEKGAGMRKYSTSQFGRKRHMPGRFVTENRKRYR